MDNLGLERFLAQLWFDDVRKAQGMNRVPYDAPEHMYDNYALYRAGFKPSDVGPDGHLPSYYKHADHPNRFVDGRDTKTTSEPWIRKGKPYWGLPKGPR